MKNCKGFTLVEMMVVVAIIGALSFIAVPAYKTFRAKARQKEGFSLMASYHAAAQSTRAEFGHYPGNFVQTGFQPVGQLGYRVFARDGNNIAGVPNDNACITTAVSAACDCAGQCPNFKKWTEINGVVGTSLGAVACGGGAAGCGGRTLNDTTFNIYVCGVINMSATNIDQYSINQNKRIAMCRDGTK